MTPQQFIAKWQRVTLGERSACQQHFLDLCDLLGHAKPAEADPEGTHFTFERGASKTDGGDGWADVWKRNFFGWEYKGKHKNLVDAYRQLLQYRESLENPPLLVVCDMDRFEVHTNFTGTVKVTHAFDLAGLDNPANLDILRRTFFEPESLKPGLTRETITKAAAESIGQIADSLRQRKFDPPAVAHFLMKLMFCMFAEDIGLLPTKLFTRLVDGAKNDPARLAKQLHSLFAAMADGGDFGADAVLHFNGGLFADSAVIELNTREIGYLAAANVHNWADVEPSIFGTLFERLLDPAKRSQIGAHYTHPDDIQTLVEPVVMAPLRREWAEIKGQCDGLWPKIQQEARQAAKSGAKRRGRSKPLAKFEKLLAEFDERLAHVRILDPACGSGNFLYVAIKLLLDLEKEVISYAAAHGLTRLQHVRPTQLAGIEINPYAYELAQVVIWIGYLQWMHHNGCNPPRDPVLDPIESIHCMDAILDLSDPEHPKEPKWPDADFIVGNPPFLGGKLLRTNLGDDYVDAVFRLWDGRVQKEADLCCYWFEKARRHVERKKCQRAGLLATQGIRGGANRETLKRILETGGIFWAMSDRDWILDGANVHVSMVAFDDGSETERLLDLQGVNSINANLTSSADTTSAVRLVDNLTLSFMGDTKGGSFDISFGHAAEFLNAPNPHGRPNSDVVVPWFNGLDVTRRNRDMWIIDFGTDARQADAARYERPFEYIHEHVYPERRKNKRESYKRNWWLHVEARSGMRTKLSPLPRFLITITVSKHRLFVWAESPTLPDHQLIVFACDDDDFFGVLHSRVHEVWARAQGTQVRERESGFRYTPTTCFETFPFPEPTDDQRAAIADSAKELDDLRSRWLNPPEWTHEEVLEFPGSADGPWARYVHDPDARGIGTVRYPRLAPRDDECAKQLAKRTLTNLYNQRPAWLDLAHQKLDAAVFAAYGWPADLSDDDLLARLLELNLARAGG